jgi:phytoene dehydrogenase-like protein
LRPLPGMAQYSTPIDGLWLASAGTHPGGGISGAAGWNAADRIIKEGRA